MEEDMHGWSIKGREGRREEGGEGSSLLLIQWEALKLRSPSSMSYVSCISLVLKEHEYGWEECLSAAFSLLCCINKTLFYLFMCAFLLSCCCCDLLYAACSV